MREMSVDEIREKLPLILQVKERLIERGAYVDVRVFEIENNEVSVRWNIETDDEVLQHEIDQAWEEGKRLAPKVRTSRRPIEADISEDIWDF